MNNNHDQFQYYVLEEFRNRSQHAYKNENTHILAAEKSCSGGAANWRGHEVVRERGSCARECGVRRVQCVWVCACQSRRSHTLDLLSKKHLNVGQCLGCLLYVAVCLWMEAEGTQLSWETGRKSQWCYFYIPDHVIQYLKCTGMLAQPHVASECTFQSVSIHVPDKYNFP